MGRRVGRVAGVLLLVGLSGCAQAVRRGDAGPFEGDASGWLDAGASLAELDGGAKADAGHEGVLDARVLADAAVALDAASDATTRRDGVADAALGSCEALEDTIADELAMSAA